MKKLIVVLAAMMLGQQAFCGYGAAGCGVGSIIFKDNNEWWAQTLAATTNGTLGNQTFGITTGTLECDANALVSNMEKAQVFVAANKKDVSNDIARGQGERIAVLSKLMNCSDDSEFANQLKANYQEIFKDDSAQKITNKIKNVAEQTSSCQPLA